MKQLAIRKLRRVILLFAFMRPYIKRLAIAGGALLFVMFGVYLLQPHKIAYEYGGNNCVNKITILPTLHIVESKELTVSDERMVRIFGKNIVSRKTCFSINNIYAQNTPIDASKSFLRIPIAAQRYTIYTTELPKVLFSSSDKAPVPVDGNIELLLDKSDTHFTYVVSINEQNSTCNSKGIRVTCSIAGLNLAHKTNYTAQITRELGTQKLLATDLSFQTVESLNIVGQSIVNGQQVITKPSEIVIATDKQLAKASDAVLQKGEEMYKTTVTVKDSNVYVSLPDNLPRDALYTLTLADIRGKNGESMKAPLVTQFYLTAGPKVTGMSIADRAVSRTANVSVFFDQQLASKDYASTVALYQNGNKVPSTVRHIGATLQIVPSTSLETCAELRIEVNGELVNIYDVPRTEQWTGKSRVTCASVFSIGSSVEGRAMVAYSFGSGAREVLYIGTLHGDEKNTKRLLDKWIYELEGNPGAIPVGTRVVVIPLLNPDGYAKSSRYNSRMVDLNRNFPAYNWKSDVVVQGGQTLFGGGGAYALSENESAAIANYISSHRPAVVASYHSKGGIVESNEATGANALAQSYAAQSKYGYRQASTNQGFFAYDTNGSLEEWAKDKLQQPVLLIELSTSTNDEFTKNRKAMWGLL